MENKHQNTDLGSRNSDVTRALNSELQVPRKTRALPGFTLIEMIVAVAIFMFVMVIAVGSLVSIIGADRKVQSIQAVADNLQFALDDMSRSVRTGYSYSCTPTDDAYGNCASSGGDTLSFINQSNQHVRYQFASASVCGAAFTGGCLRRSLDDGVTYLPLTSPDILIDAGRFYVVGALRGDGLQPKVTVTLSGHISQGLQTPTYLYLQTTLTQRIYDQ